MPEQKKDLRVAKTRKLVFDAIAKLLKRRRFESITVLELCEAAQISRATFYVHFEDKYDLLKLWLTSLFSEVHSKAKNAPTEREQAQCLASFVDENKKILENLLTYNTGEALEIIFNSLLPFSNIYADRNNKSRPEYAVSCNICIGGMIAYLIWQVKNKFPKDVPLLNEHFFDFFKKYFL